MIIWKTEATPAHMNQRNESTMADFIGLKVTQVAHDHVVAELMISDRVRQPLGIMNGGASCVIAESLGSTAANYTVDPNQEFCVGLDINTNHLRPVSQGLIQAVAEPIHLGKSTQVWSIVITNEQGKKVSISRLTMAVRSR